MPSDTDFVNSVRGLHGMDLINAFYPQSSTRPTSTASAMGGAPSLPGTTQAGSGPWGAVPAVPDPAGSMRSAINANTSSLGDLMGLAQRINAFNVGEARAPYLTGLPDYQNMLNQSSRNIGSALRGELGDLIPMLGQWGAERGVGRGTSGSPNENAAYLRALGLTSLDRMAQGERDLTQAIGRTPTAPVFDVNQLMLHPDDIQAAQWAANQAAAAPNPAQQAAEMMRLFNEQLRRSSGAGGGGGAFGPGGQQIFPAINRGISAPNINIPNFSSGASSPSGGGSGVYGALGPFAPPSTPYGWNDFSWAGRGSTGMSELDQMLQSTYSGGQGQSDLWSGGLDQWSAAPPMGGSFYGGSLLGPSAPNYYSPFPDLDTETGIPSLWEGWNDPPIGGPLFSDSDFNLFG